VYDEDICYDDYAFNLIQFYNWTKTYISELQEKHPPRIFANFLHLAETWNERIKSENRKMNSLIRKTRKEGTIVNKNI